MLRVVLLQVVLWVLLPVVEVEVVAVVAQRTMKGKVPSSQPWTVL
jgi:hypothetical protein